MTKSVFRIRTNQAAAARAKQALMIASNELGIFTYYWPHQLADPAQRDSLLHMLAEQFSATLPLTDDPSGVFYLVVLDDEPILVPEADALAFTLGVVLGRRGIEEARRVSYRAEMLPAPQE